MSDETIKRLREKGIAPTIQRLVVIEYLKKSTTHPTVEEIYEALKGDYPTFSRATVYNTLQVLKKAGLIQELTIEKEKAHYDLRAEPHHHFHCRQCRRIYDVDVDCPVIKGGYVDGHRIEMVQAYFYGLCAVCQKEGKDA
jgi:Fur family peroxide stress response transcriptional regulator